MNSVANGKIRARTPFEKIYVQPAASDNGTALGAAYFVWHQRLGNPRAFVMDHALWDTSYEDCDVESLLNPVGAVYDRASADAHRALLQVTRFQSSEETCRTTARLLAEPCGGFKEEWNGALAPWATGAFLRIPAAPICAT